MIKEATTSQDYEFGPNLSKKPGTTSKIGMNNMFNNTKVFPLPRVPIYYTLAARILVHPTA